jgi:hypothetical protein
MYVFVFALLVVLYKNEREERKGGASSERGLCHTHAMRKNHARRRASIITANREEEQFKPSFAGKRTRRTHLKFKICIHAFASATKTPTTFFTRTQSPNKKKSQAPFFLSQKSFQMMCRRARKCNRNKNATTKEAHTTTL